MKIDLAKYKKKSIKVLSGRELGEKHRVKANLGSLEKNNEKIIILVPDDIYSINSSYFLGFFGQSIKELGEKQFREKYQFDCDSVIRKNIEDGISSALKDSNNLWRM